MKKNISKKKEMVLSVVGLLLLIVITVGTTYAFFNYTKNGTTDNSITLGDSITFLYTEVDKIGNGISIQDAFPISDSQGKLQTGDRNVFNFKITSNTSNNYSIPYEITARMKDGSTLDQEAVKVYLTKVTGEKEEEVLLEKYSELDQTKRVEESKYIEKTLYTDRVPANSKNYEQAYRLRMWISDDVDFSSENMNNKTFILTVNVYSNAKVVTEEDSNAEISIISVNEEELKKVEDKSYDYEKILPEGTKKATITVETENPYATVNIEKIDNLAYIGPSSNIKRLSSSNTVELNEEDNYFKITIKSEDKEVVKEYKLRIYVETIDIVIDIPYHIFEGEDYSVVAKYTSNGNNHQESCTIDGKEYSSTKELSLGDYMISCTITTENGNKKTINRELSVIEDKVQQTITAESILKAISDNELNNGYYTFVVNNETYPVHVYNFDSNKYFEQNEKFGVAKDIATENEYATNMVIVKVKGNLTIKNGKLIEPYYTEYGGPKGFTLYVTGTLTNNGIIDNSHGAKAEGQDVYLWKNTNGSYETVPSEGATGGDELSLPNTLSPNSTTQYYQNGNDGKPGENRQTGGGGTGGIALANNSKFTATASQGGTGTSYSGGSGSGGVDVNPSAGTYTSGAGSNVGGAGGTGRAARANSSWANRTAGGGAGNPGGVGGLNGSGNSTTYSGSNGTGGLLIIYANSFINNSKISADGSPGGDGRAKGGSSGGGSINIFTFNQITTKGTVEANGGNPVSMESNYHSGAGGAGTITYTKIQ